MRRFSTLLLPLTLRGVEAQTDLTRHPQWRRHRHRGYGKEIIVDMGFNIGQDTAAYLELGYDVVAVEANPRLSAWANQSEPFKSALASSRLTLLNRLVVEKDSPRATIPFFMGSHTERSVPYSCDTPPCEEVQVPTISCDKLVVDYSPLYIKKRVTCSIDFQKHCVQKLFEEVPDNYSEIHGRHALRILAIVVFVSEK